MPVRNRNKLYGEGHYYHVYNRGVNKMEIFREHSDYIFFMHILKQHLSGEEFKDKQGRLIKDFSEHVDLNAFCLMPNHYHLLFYLKDKRGIELVMRSIMTRYSHYFNRKYDRVGPLFQNNYLASRISTDAYFWHITRYIHRNPDAIVGTDYTTYRYSSYPYYTGEFSSKWIHPEAFVSSYDDQLRYIDFVADTEDYDESMLTVSLEVANTDHLINNE